jgi:hypothetical protein
MARQAVALPISFHTKYFERFTTLFDNNRPLIENEKFLTTTSKFVSTEFFPTLASTVGQTTGVQKKFFCSFGEFYICVCVCTCVCDDV